MSYMTLCFTTFARSTKKIRTTTSRKMCRDNNIIMFLFSLIFVKKYSRFHEKLDPIEIRMTQTPILNEQLFDTKSDILVDFISNSSWKNRRRKIGEEKERSMGKIKRIIINRHIMEKRKIAVNIERWRIRPTPERVRVQP